MTWLEQVPQTNFKALHIVDKNETFAMQYTPTIENNTELTLGLLSSTQCLSHTIPDTGHAHGRMTGLPNFGNTCFANVVIQMIACDKHLTNVICRRSSKRPETKQLVHKLALLLTSLRAQWQSSDQTSEITDNSSTHNYTREFITALQPWFEVNAEGDAAELFLFLLEQVEPIPILDDENDNDILHQITGLYCTTIKCNGCWNVVKREQSPFRTYELLFHGFEHSIRDMLEASENANRLDRQCKCGSASAEGWTHIVRHPRVLVLNVIIAGYRLDVPLTKTIHIHSQSSIEIIYNLQAVIVYHSHNGDQDGRGTSGHYTTFVHADDGWYHCDDGKVVRQSDLPATAKASILLYRMKI